MDFPGLLFLMSQYLRSAARAEISGSRQFLATVMAEERTGSILTGNFIGEARFFIGVKCQCRFGFRFRSYRFLYR